MVGSITIIERPSPVEGSHAADHVCAVCHPYNPPDGAQAGTDRPVLLLSVIQCERKGDVSNQMKAQSPAMVCWQAGEPCAPSTTPREPKPADVSKI
jgi:hypothetical protein